MPQNLSHPFQGCNRTELYQLCLRSGLVVHPMTDAATLSRYLTGEEQPPPLTPEEHPVNRWRYGLIDFIGDHWTALQAQITCPARNLKNPDPSKRDPLPCFGCSDAQVMFCLAENEANLPRIERYVQLRRKS